MSLIRYSKIYLNNNLIIFLFAVGISAITGCADRPAKTHKSQESHNALLWLSGEYVRRGDEFGAALLLDTIKLKNRGSHWFAAYALVRLQQFQPVEAERLYKKSLTLDGNNLHARLNYSSLLIKQQKYKSAKEHLTIIIDNHIDNKMSSYAYFNMGLISYIQNKIKPSIILFLKAAQSCLQCKNPKETQEFYDYYFFHIRKTQGKKLVK